MNSVEYTNGGFGVLFKKSTQEVLVWKDVTYETIFPGTKQFKRISDFDSNLAAQPITTSNVFEYRDALNGEDWIVSSYPFFQPGMANSPSNSGNTLVILVFARRSLAEDSLDSLNSNIDYTTNNIVTATAIIIGCTIGATMLLCFLVIDYLARPLEAMRLISEEITAMSAEDEDKKEYRGLIQKAFVNLSRTDEVGLLAVEYYYILCLLHNKNMEKRNAPKYPPNPFHLGSNVNYDQLSWGQFVQMYESRNNVQLYSLPATTPAAAAEYNASSDLDVLSSISSRPGALTYTAVATADNAVNNTTSPEGGSSQYMDVASEQQEVGWCTSMKSQLYFLSSVLLTGVTITMLITVIALSKQGTTWMSTSTSRIDNTQVVNMQAITAAKGAYVKVA